jgi:DNA-binding NarL/FixJ family response regulator
VGYFSDADSLGGPDASGKGSSGIAQVQGGKETKLMAMAQIRILVVDDYELWHRFVSTVLGKNPDLKVIGQLSDGLEAVRQAEKLQPDLILLDIGLPKLNGIEAARRIRQVSPNSKILFMSEQRSADIAEEALSTGAGGYVVKSDAAGELLPAIKAVLEGKRFISPGLAGVDAKPAHSDTVEHTSREVPIPLVPQSGATNLRRHEVGFYSDDQELLDAATKFIADALKMGNAAIVLATEPHQNILLQTLRACGLDVGTAIEQGRYIQLDVAHAISTFIVDGMPDAVRFIETFSNLIQAASQATKQEHPRVAFFGESVHVLWEQGNPNAAVQIEKLCNVLGEKYDLDILCGYCLGSIKGAMDTPFFQDICLEHSAVDLR